MATRVKPLKDTTDALEAFDQELAPNTDALDARGLYIQNDTSNDTKAFVTRDASDHVVMTDGAIPLSRKLVDALLEGLDIAAGTSTAYTYTSGRVSNETTTLTSSSLSLRTIDYTYTAGKLTTEVTKIFAANGVTIVGQVTKTYAYSGANISSITEVRNV